MKRKKMISMFSIMITSILFAGCGKTTEPEKTEPTAQEIADAVKAEVDAAVAELNEYTDQINSEIEEMKTEIAEETETDVETEEKTIIQSAYFDSTDYEAYENIVRSGVWDELYAAIKEFDPQEDDPAYMVLQYLDPVMEHWDSISIEYDDFDNLSRFYYGDLKDLSSTIHFVPFASSNEPKIFVKVGFYADDWIFFDDIKLNTDESYHAGWSRTIDKVEDVTNGGILEYLIYSLEDKDIEQFFTSETHKIRFFNRDNEKHYDFDLSDQEVEAFEVIKDFYWVRNDILDTAYDYYKEKEVAQ